MSTTNDQIFAASTNGTLALVQALVGTADGIVNTNAGGGLASIGQGGGILAGVSPVLYNGSTWDRQRGQTDNVTVLASAAQTATFNGADQTNFNFRGVALLINVSASSGTLPTLTATVQFKDPVSGVYYTPATGAMVTGSITGVSSTALMIYPGITGVANASFNSTLTRTWRLVYTIGGTTPSFTFSVGASYLL